MAWPIGLTGWSERCECEGKQEPRHSFAASAGWLNGVGGRIAGARMKHWVAAVLALTGARFIDRKAYSST